MKLELKLHPVTLHLKDTFTISRDSYSERRSLIVELSAAGKSGFGETSEHSYYGIMVENLVERAEALRPVVGVLRFHQPGRILECFTATTQ